VVSVVVGRGVCAGGAGVHSELETAPARSPARAVSDRRGGWMHPGGWCRQAAKQLPGHSLNCDRTFSNITGMSGGQLLPPLWLEALQRLCGWDGDVAADHSAGESSALVH